MLNASKQVEFLKKCGISDGIISHILNVIPPTFPRLKGGDHVVFESAKLLKLPVHVKPFLNHQGYDDDTGKEHRYALKELYSHVILMKIV